MRFWGGERSGKVMAAAARVVALTRRVDVHAKELRRARLQHECSTAPRATATCPQSMGNAVRGERVKALKKD